MLAVSITSCIVMFDFDPQFLDQWEDFKEK